MVAAPDFKLTLMHRACRDGVLGACMWIYDHGGEATVTAEDLSGETPLHQAAEHSNLDIAQWLVGHGAQECVRKFSRLGHSPMVRLPDE